MDEEEIIGYIKERGYDEREIKYLRGQGGWMDTAFDVFEGVFHFLKAGYTKDHIDYLVQHGYLFSREFRIGKAGYMWGDLENKDDSKLNEMDELIGAGYTKIEIDEKMGWGKGEAKLWAPAIVETFNKSEEAHVLMGMGYDPDDILEMIADGLDLKSVLILCKERVESEIEHEIGLFTEPELHTLLKQDKEARKEIKKGEVPDDKNTINVVQKIIKSLETKEKPEVSIEEIIELSEVKGVKPEQTEEAIEKLKLEGFLFSPKKGVVAFVR